MQMLLILNRLEKTNESGFRLTPFCIFAAVEPDHSKNLISVFLEINF